MKAITLLFALLLPALASAGVLEDMEEALIRSDAETAIQLIKRGVDMNSVDKNGNTLLMQSVQRDIPGLFDYLLQRRARLNTRNRHGETALSLAAYAGRLPYVQRLVQAGAEVNLFDWSPLSYAVYNGHTAVADYLLQHGAEVDAKTGNGSTALFFAARFGHEEIVELLLKNHADPGIVNENGDSAIDWALKSKNTEIADRLRAAMGR